MHCAITIYRLTIINHTWDTPPQTAILNKIHSYKKLEKRYERVCKKTSILFQSCLNYFGHEYDVISQKTMKHTVRTFFGVSMNFHRKVFFQTCLTQHDQTQQSNSGSRTICLNSLPPYVFGRNLDFRKGKLRIWGEWRLPKKVKQKSRGLGFSPCIILIISQAQTLNLLLVQRCHGDCSNREEI